MVHRIERRLKAGTLLSIHVDHGVVIRKLKDFGLHDILIRWFCSFLKDRQQRVVIGEHVSDWITLTGAMPQGSWLGPLAFLVLINDLTAACHVQKFVDDTTLSEVLRVDQPSRMQENLDDIVSQSAASLMNINVKKTKDVRLGACARKQQYQDLILEGNVIENVKSYKLLRVHFTQTLK